MIQRVPTQDQLLEHRHVTAAQRQHERLENLSVGPRANDYQRSVWNLSEDERKRSYERLKSLSRRNRANEKHDRRVPVDLLEPLEHVLVRNPRIVAASVLTQHRESVNAQRLL